MSSMENEFIWEKLTFDLKKKMDKIDYDLFEKNFSLIKRNKEVFLIGFTDADIYRGLTAKYSNEIYLAACSACNGIATVKYKKIASQNTVEPQMHFEGTKPRLSKPSRAKKSLGNLFVSVVCICLAALFVIIGVNVIDNLNFKEVFYTASANKVVTGFRIIQISDLHNTSYGKNNSTLIHRIKTLEPDLIAITGDCINSESGIDQIAALCKELKDIAPTYYIYGNNECEIAFQNDMTLESLDSALGFSDKNRDPEKLYKKDNGLREKLEKSGVKLLFNEYETIKIGENYIDVFGTLTSNPSAFWDYAGENFNKYLNETQNHFKLFLAHEPLLYETLGEEYWGDLALSGDTHGGIVKLPIVGPIYSRGFGILPQMKGHMVYGKFKSGKTQVIVSSGLTNKGLVRINNKPELSIVDVISY